MITLATLAQATEQQVFDQIVTHLRKQGVQSKTESGCCYRDGNGRMCAAGCLISDEEYTPSMDQASGGIGSNWPNLIRRGEVPDAHRKLIKAMQDLHDDRLPEKWESGFVFVASNFDLVVPAAN